MPERVPPVDVSPTESQSNSDYELKELEVLQMEAKLKQIQTNEWRQRYWLRWIATGVGLLIIFGMASMMMHLLHQIFWGPFAFVSPAFSVAVIVAPTLSITGITVALFVGAFRKFKDGDLEQMSSSAISGAHLFK